MTPRTRLAVGALAVLLAGQTAALGWTAWRLEAAHDDLEALRRQDAATTSSVTNLDRRMAAADGRLQSLDAQVRAGSGRLDAVESEIGEEARARLDVGAVVSAAQPSVVTVTCGTTLGSGFALDLATGAAGVAVVTNHHVVAGCTGETAPGTSPGTTPSPSAPASPGVTPAPPVVARVGVSQGGVALPTTLAAWDADNDLALLVVDADLPVLEPATAAKVGDPVVAIGSPYGLEGTVTQGILSKVWEDAFQTDAAINPGNSGGPLLDRSGRVLGVNTEKLRDSEGLNFAVRVRRLCQEVVTGTCPFTL